MGASTSLPIENGFHIHPYLCGQFSFVQPKVSGSARPSGARSPARQSLRMPRYTPGQRRRLVKQFQASGLTLAAFCQQHALSPSSLCSWRRQLQRLLQAGLPESASPQWLPVEVSSSPGSTAPQPPCVGYLIEAGAWRLHVPTGFGRDELGVLLELLHARQGGAPC